MLAKGDSSVQLTERFQGRGRAVLTASNALEYAWEGEDLTGMGSPSIFTAAVVQALRTGEAERDGDGLISVDELYDYVFERVREETPRQTPSKWSNVEGKLVIARSVRRPTAEAAVLPADVLQALQSPYASVRAGGIAPLVALARNRSREFAALAESTLRELVDDDSREVGRLAAEALSALAGAEHEPPAERAAVQASPALATPMQVAAPAAPPSTPPSPPRSGPDVAPSPGTAYSSVAAQRTPAGSGSPVGPELFGRPAAVVLLAALGWAAAVAWAIVVQATVPTDDPAVHLWVGYCLQGGIGMGLTFLALGVVGWAGERWRGRGVLLALGAPLLPSWFLASNHSVLMGASPNEDEVVLYFVVAVVALVVVMVYAVIPVLVVAVGDRALDRKTVVATAGLVGLVAWIVVQLGGDRLVESVARLWDEDPTSVAGAWVPVALALAALWFLAWWGVRTWLGRAEPPQVPPTP
jgi:hypothetical protein